MAKSVLELAVGTGQWDAGLKKAKSALDNFTQSQGGLQQALAKDSENMRKFVQMMGKTESTAKTAKGQMNDYKSTIEQLTMQYNRMTDAQKKTIGQDYIQSIDQLKQKYQSVNEELQEMNRSLNGTKQEMQGLGNAVDDIKSKGSLFGEGGLTGMLQVAGGNLLAQGITKMGSELADTVQQSIQLARAGEGIRLAFDRLNQPDLLDKLKAATHGTISEVELMKAAVRFDDFKLPLDQLGTMLAFAQQKAKDTGQSFTYMVDSIVTGLGRQSPKILDNLGLSITEIHQKTKETGDMTKAVGEIIREQMKKAGEYVETAADKAARAAADAENEMEKFGRSAAPVAEEFAQVWKALSIGAMDFANTLLGPVANSIRSLQNIWNNGWEDNIINSKFNLENGNYTPPKTGYQGMGKLQSVAAPGGYVEVTDKNTGAVIGGRHFNNLSDKNVIKDWQKGLFKNSKTGGGGSSIQEEKDDFTEIIGLIGNAQERVSDLQRRIKEAPDETTISVLRDQLKEAQAELDRLNGKGDDLDKIFPDRGVSGGTQLSRGQQLEQEIRISIAEGNINADMTTLKTLLETQIKNGIEGVNIPSDELIQKIIGEGINIPDEYWEGLQTQINDKLKELGIDPIKIDFKTGNISSGGKNENATLKQLEKFNGDYSKVTGGVSSIVSGIQQMGVEIPQEIQSVLGVLTGISSIMTGIVALLTLIEIDTKTTAGASVFDAIIPLARGGVVKAAGGTVAGTTYSGDQIPALLNAGEVVLNRSQVSNLASTLEGPGMQGMKLSAVISGEQIRLVLNNNGRRTGKGEYVQTNFR